uniref:Uncharacterized protein n=1 Tax=uncultured prokaryote TaxID=198431 RepID=A0A0H5Q4M9_9ZZZZ|nr:hypothetical protein [uncultured prokaryote]
MADYITQVTLHTASGITADYVTNTWAFESSVSTLAGLHSDLFHEYDLIHTLLSSTIAQVGHEISSYDRADPIPRAPVLTTFHSFATATGSTSLPTEVALCLSFQGSKVSGVPQARRRGRVYIGPLYQAASDTAGRPTSGVRTSLAAMGAHVKAFAANGYWQVWSTVNNSPTLVVDGWIDNSFDTQRRRGVEATARTTF